MKKKTLNSISIYIYQKCVHYISFSFIYDFNIEAFFLYKNTCYKNITISYFGWGNNKSITFTTIGEIRIIPGLLGKNVFFRKKKILWAALYVKIYFL